jgi:hypothetical protein
MWRNLSPQAMKGSKFKIPLKFLMKVRPQISTSYECITFLPILILQGESSPIETTVPILTRNYTIILFHSQFFYTL